MLSNAYFLAKFRFDTAENELAKNLQKFANFPSFANPNPLGFAGSAARAAAPIAELGRPPGWRRRLPLRGLALVTRPAK